MEDLQARGQQHVNRFIYQEIDDLPQLSAEQKINSNALSTIFISHLLYFKIDHPKSINWIIYSLYNYILVFLYS